MQSARIRATLLLAAIVLLTSLGAASSTTKEDEFWAWFQANEDRLYNFESNAAPAMADMIRELEKVNENLSFQIGPADGDGQRDFVLSVDGYLEGFPAVEALHAAAPDLPRWMIIKFRQRKKLGGGTMMAVADGMAQLGQVRYIMAPDGLTTSIALFFPGADDMPDETIGELAWLILQDALGEEDYGRHVRHVSVSDTTHKYYDVSKPIAELPSEFDAAFKN